MNKITIQDMNQFKYLSNLTTSPLFSKMAFVVSKPDLKENTYTHTLMFSDGVNHSKAVDIGKSSQYYWESETSILVPYAKTEDEKKAVSESKTVLYRYDLNSKTFEYATTLYLPVSNIFVEDKSTWIVFSALNENEHGIYEDPANRDDYINATKEEREYVEIFEEIPFYSDGGTFSRGKNVQAFRYNPQTKELKRLFDKDVSVGVQNFQRDYHKLYLTAKKETGVGSFFQDGYVYDVRYDKLDKLFENDNLAISYLWEQYGAVYAMAATHDTFGINTNKDIYILRDGSLDKSYDFGLSGGNSVGSDARLGGSRTYRVGDNGLSFVGTYHDRTMLYTFDSHSLKTEYAPQGSIDGWVSFENRVYAIGLFGQDLQELVTLNEDNSVTRRSSFNKEIMSDKYVATPIHHEFENDGVTLDGWVLLPKDYNPSKTYPAILDIHGGPKTIYNDVYYHEMQVWANEGYVVFFTNPRGGDAYGNEFMDIRGKYGTIDYDDIMKFTDIVLDAYPIDPKRVGVTGGSYGGFMTNWIVSHTNRFAAAATQRSISNWISFYGTSDIGYYFQPDQTAADPIDDMEKAWEQSPLKHARNITTPLLFIHSDEDFRCPIEQGLQLYTVVKKQGVDTRFVWFKNESHGLSRGGRPKSRIKRLEEITSWMNKYLK
ncbi:dipeptidyl aminopeptidase [Erysipelothrix larvae]|uniref:Dipeptidyl aminopeptidase n=1 Tax=Erysipelothrix larvae TaxID=1514105 RepID=A0A0X8H1K1_9FIRM|nr:S9 family peptidase [Erysipelothrix larvae]AMC94422.1 dipeptidyl aminopeptidase [Erysipelothrix larvae]